MKRLILEFRLNKLDKQIKEDNNKSETHLKLMNYHLSDLNYRINYLIIINTYLEAENSSSGIMPGNIRRIKL